MKFVVCGEALIDMFLLQQVSASESHWSALSAGSPLNTAVALRRLGEETSFLGRLGGDAFGAQFRQYVEENQVGTDLLVQSEDPTTLAIVSLDEGGRASYVFHVRGTSNFGWQDDELPQLGPDVWLHMGSIASVIEPAFDPLLRFAQTTQASVSYDINVRPSLLPDRDEYVEKVTAYLAAVGNSAGIVKASDEDINWLTDDDDPLSYATEWAAEFGLAAFILTLGPDGAVGIKPDGRVVEVPGRRVEVADTIGAGDTFMAGFLSRYCAQPDDLEAALAYGAAAAALVCQERGANPPTREQVDALVAE